MIYRRLVLKGSNNIRRVDLRRTYSVGPTPTGKGDLQRKVNPESLRTLMLKPEGRPDVHRLSFRELTFNQAKNPNHHD